jgi:hypothetical protein
MVSDLNVALGLVIFCRSFGLPPLRPIETTGLGIKRSTCAALPKHEGKEAFSIIASSISLRSNPKAVTMSIGESTTWQVASAEKRRQCAEKIPKAWRLAPSFLEQFSLGPTSGTNAVALDLVRKSGILTESEFALTENFTAQELVVKLAGGVVTSEAVTVAFSTRAAIAKQVVRFG